jgi:hypothetical protein
MIMKFWDLGRRDADEEEFWGNGRSRKRPYQTMDPPDFFGALPRPYRWLYIALMIAAVIVLSYLDVHR